MAPSTVKKTQVFGGDSALIEDQIKNIINLYEPRVVCYRVKTEFNERDNDLQVEIYYLITGLPNVIDNLEVILKR